MSRVFDEKFSSHSTENFCRGSRLCFRKFRVSKNSMHKRGISQISIENLLSHSTEDFREGILCFWKNPGSEKIFWMKSGVSCFSVENFWSHIAEEFREHPFIVSKKLGYRKNLCIKGDHVFPSNSFGVTKQKPFVGIPSMFHKIWGIEKF